MSKSLYLVSFVAGALAGSAASWFVLKKKYEKIAQEEIDSVKEAFSYKQAEAYSEKDEDDKPADEDCEDPDENDSELKAYNKIIETNGYNANEAKKPSYTKVISPVELGDIEWYKIVGLTYYADGVLADEDGNIVNVDETIGAYALTQFGEYDDDAVHVRNTKLETDFEVLLDERDYSEVFN